VLGSAPDLNLSETCNSPQTRAIRRYRLRVTLPPRAVRLTITSLITVALLLASSATLPAASARSVKPTPQQRNGLPSRQTWLADVHTAMTGSRIYLKNRADGSDERLALNLDIDNTSLATAYGGGAIPEMLKFTRFAQRHHVAVLFNTGQKEGLRSATVRLLRDADYSFDELCMRPAGGALAAHKRACRAHFADEGYTVIENIGNRSTDLVGGGYEKGYKLPDYGGLLG